MDLFARKPSLSRPAKPPPAGYGTGEIGRRLWEAREHLEPPAAATTSADKNVHCTS